MTSGFETETGVGACYEDGLAVEGRGGVGEGGEELGAEEGCYEAWGSGGCVRSLRERWRGRDVLQAEHCEVVGDARLLG